MNDSRRHFTHVQVQDSCSQLILQILLELVVASLLEVDVHEVQVPVSRSCTHVVKWQWGQM